MTARTKKGKSAEEKDVEWEESILNSHEKPKIEAVLQGMQLPMLDEQFDNQRLRRLAENVCLQLKLKDPRWERFLLDPKKQGCKKYMRLQEMIYEAVKRASPSPETTPG
jgi:hypothetical protein